MSERYELRSFITDGFFIQCRDCQEPMTVLRDFPKDAIFQCPKCKNTIEIKKEVKG